LKSSIEVLKWRAREASETLLGVTNGNWKYNNAHTYLVCETSL